MRAALELDEEERAEVASRVLDSLERLDSAEEAAWEEKLERRAKELETGAVQGIPWDDLEAKLLKSSRGA